jgi:broad specificity phosphatase PhoE
MKSEHANLQHKPFLMPLWLSAFAAIAAFAIFSFALFTIWVWFTASSTTVVVIRHADKELVAASDPALSPVGEARAALLARMFGEAQGGNRIDAIYISATLRSRMTAAPLAERLKITPIVAPADDARALAHRALSDNAGKRVLIVGHANTVPAIVDELSGKNDTPQIDEKDFGVMYVVSVPRIGHANVLRLTY